MTDVIPSDPHDRLDRLFRTHAERIYRYARTRLEHEDAEDLVCDVFEIAWDRLPETPRHELAWLLGVARRLLLSRHRASVRRRLLTDRAGEIARLTGDDPAVAVTTLAELTWALGELTPRDQEVLGLVAVHDLSPEELGTALGCRPNTATARVSRARARLSRILRSTATDTLPTPQEANL